MREINIPFLLAGLLILGLVPIYSYIGNIPHIALVLFSLFDLDIKGIGFLIGLLLIFPICLLKAHLKKYVIIFKCLSALSFLYSALFLLWLGLKTGYDNQCLYIVTPAGIICILLGLFLKKQNKNNI